MVEEEIESDSDAAAQPSPTWPSPAEPVNSESDDSDDLDEQICQTQAGARIAFTLFSLQPLRPIETFYRLISYA